jgi:hypothetical protein
LAYLTDIVPNFSINTPIRVSVYLYAMSQPNTNDVAICSIEYINQYTWYQWCPGNIGVGSYPFATLQAQASRLGSLAGNTPTSDNVHIMTLPDGIAGVLGVYSAGPATDGGWPTSSLIDPVGVMQQTSVTYVTYSNWANGSAWDLNLGAASSSSTSSVTYGRVKVEYKP